VQRCSLGLYPYRPRSSCSTLLESPSRLPTVYGSERASLLCSGFSGAEDETVRGTSLRGSVLSASALSSLPQPRFFFRSRHRFFIIVPLTERKTQSNQINGRPNQCDCRTVTSYNHPTLATTSRCSDRAHPSATPRRWSRRVRLDVSGAVDGIFWE